MSWRQHTACSFLRCCVGFPRSCASAASRIHFASFVTTAGDSRLQQPFATGDEPDPSAREEAEEPLFPLVAVFELPQRFEVPRNPHRDRPPPLEDPESLWEEFPGLVPDLMPDRVPVGVWEWKTVRGVLLSESHIA